MNLRKWRTFVRIASFVLFFLGLIALIEQALGWAKFYYAKLAMSVGRPKYSSLQFYADIINLARVVFYTHLGYLGMRSAKSSSLSFIHRVFVSSVWSTLAQFAILTFYFAVYGS